MATTFYYPALIAHGPGRTGGIAPANATTTYILGNTVLTGTTQTVLPASLAHQPDVCRVLTVKGNAGGMTGNVVITGQDSAGSTITDTIAVSGTDTVAGVKAFKSISSIVVPAKTNVSGDQLAIGTANIFGLASKLSNTGLLLLAQFNGSTDSGSLAVSSTVLSQNLWTIAGTPNGTKKLDLYYIVA